MTQKLILAINPGSTSTKIAIFLDKKAVFLKNLTHTEADLASFKQTTDQFAFRRAIILEEIEKAGFNLNDLQIIMGRGGLSKPIKSGVYEVNEALRRDLSKGVLGQHASNLGGLIADDIASHIPHAKAYIADPVVVDEMKRVARVTGHPLFERISIFHALNQKATAREYASEIGVQYEKLNLIVAHLGGGVSVGAHQKGRVIDVNNALDGEGPFSPERSGTLPMGAFAKLCFSGTVTYEEVQKMIIGKGGFVAHLNTNSGKEVEEMVKAGNKHALKIQNAFAYQVGKAIGAMATSLRGKVDAILLTGGMAYNSMITNYIAKQVDFIAPVSVYPGEDEMKALAFNGLLVLNEEVIPQIYS